MVVSEAAREFGDALRRERERRGISLEQVAESTKISATVMASLERGDLSRWPTGLFRRAFVRAYSEAVGLPAEQLVQAFIDVHGDDGQRPRAVDPQRIVQVCGGDLHADGDLHALRLHLAGEPARPVSSILQRVATVAIDLALPGLCGGLMALAVGAPLLSGIGVAALASLALTSAELMRTPGQELMGRVSRPAAVAGAAEAVTAALEATVATEAPALEIEPRRAVEAVRPGARARRPTRERARLQRASRHA